MADASFVQTSFLGGEWSQFSQGRMDNPEYRTAMNICYNGLPIEESAWVRRVGTRFATLTKNAGPARVMSFSSVTGAPYTLELTDGFIRFLSGANLVVQGDINIVAALSDATPAVAQLSHEAVDWVTGDTVVLFSPTAADTTVAQQLINRQFKITVIDGFHFSLADAATGAAFDGSTVDLAANILYVGKVLEYTTPYTDSMLEEVRGVRSDRSMVLLHGRVQPQVVVPITGSFKDETNDVFAQLGFGPVDFIDGPYLDPIDGVVMNPTGTEGVITLDVTYQAFDVDRVYRQGDVVTSGILSYVSILSNNVGHTPAGSPTYWTQNVNGLAPGQAGFAAGDVGRHIRLFSEPPLWAVGTVYSGGAIVKYNLGYYTALTGSTGVPPDTNETAWAPVSGESFAVWTWGRIVSVVSQTQITLQLFGGPLLYEGEIRIWRAGVFSDTTGWPTCGTYHGGRLWFGSNEANRFDGSRAGGNPFDFAPTAPDGTVSDADAISYVLDSGEENPLLWFAPNDQGIAVGTKSSEWLISASNLSDPLTPSSIQAKRKTLYGSADAEAITIGSSVIMVQKLGRKLLDLAPDVFTNRYAAHNLCVSVKHLTKPGIREIAYQQELAPVIWARCTDGSLIGCTYKREASYGQQATVFNGWHRHVLGSGNTVTSLTTGPSVNGNLDSLTMVTYNPDTDDYRIEIMTDLFDEDGGNTDAWFLDNAVTPTCSEVDGETVKFYGLNHLNGKTVSCWAAGLDCGDYLVADGFITVPFGSDPDGEFTAAYLQAVSNSGQDFGGMAVFVNNNIVIPPPAIPPGQLVLGYIGPETGVQGYSDSALHIDWENDWLYTYTYGDEVYSGIRKFDISSGTQLLEATIPTILDGVGAPDNHILAPVCHGNGEDDHIYFPSSGSNYTVLRKIQKSDFALVDSFGIDDATPPTANREDYYPASSALVSLANHWSRFLLAQATGDGELAMYRTAKTIAHLDPKSQALSFDTVELLEYAYPEAEDDGFGNLTGEIKNPLPSFTARTPASVAAWNSGTTYAQGDAVSAGGYPALGDYAAETGEVNWISVDNGNLNHDPEGEPAPWVAGSIYAIDDEVTVSQVVYKDTEGGLSNSSPPSAPSRWDVVRDSYWTYPPDVRARFCDGETAEFMFNSTASCYALVKDKVTQASTLPLQLYRLTLTTYLHIPGAAEQIFAAVVGAVVQLVLTWLFSYFGSFLGKFLQFGAALPSLEDRVDSLRIGDIAPEDVDATWAHFVAVGPITRDGRDGNLILFVNNTVGSPTNENYVVKVSKLDASVLWATPVSGFPNDMRIETNHGGLAFQSTTGSGTYDVYVINTVDGSIADQTTVSGLTSSAAQGFSDAKGEIIMFGQLLDIPAAPAPISPTPDAFSNTYCRLTVGPGLAYPITQTAGYSIPAVIGYSYESKGQVLRPIGQADTGARNGPGFAKERRQHQFGVLLQNSQSVSFGTEFNKARPALFKTKGGTPYKKSQLFSGVHWNIIDDNYSFDSMLCWTIDRPYPLNLLAIGGFIQTQDR